MDSRIDYSRGTPEDAEVLAQIKLEIWLATYLNTDLEITENDVYAKDFLCRERVAKRADHMRHEDDINFTLVARIGDLIVGYGRAVRGSEFNEIVTLYVLPKWQGMRIGSELLRQLLDWLGNIKTVKIGVVPYNQKAILFYEKFGFTLGKEVHHENPVFPSGRDLPEVEMTLFPSHSDGGL